MKFKNLFRFSTTPGQIQKRIDAELPTWEELMQELDSEKQGSMDEMDFGLPRYQVSLDSPVLKNVTFFAVSAVLLVAGFRFPEWNQAIIYGLIGSVFLLAFLLSLKDSVFFHLESSRLHKDADFINDFQGEGSVEKGGGLLDKIFRKEEKKFSHEFFRSRLFRLHFQNILRTFQQGDRKSWVEQSHSLSEIYTLLTQGSMKAVWTIIEILPQLGLIGTLAGLIAMFRSFGLEGGLVETGIMEGFGLALGTTILANVLVLILRPVFMLNERTVTQLMSTMEVLMAMFILPTQQKALKKERMLTETVAVKPAELPAEPSFSNSRSQKYDRSEDIIHELQMITRSVQVLGERLDENDKLEKVLTELNTTLKDLNSTDSNQGSSRYPGEIPRPQERTKVIGRPR